KGGDSTPVTPIDGEKPALFKIRNPVYDPRVTPTPPNELETAERPSPEAPEVLEKPGEATEATKAAPFKLRHTIYDKSAAFGQPISSKPAESALPAMPAASRPEASLSASQQADTLKTSRAEKVASRGPPPVEAPAPADLPPNSHVVMPTLVARRPIAMWQNAPPPKPPPKDEGRRSPLAALDRKRSRELLLLSRDK
ncbi:hypothetical protein LTR53_018669, partial [Teratosphaeriaceae sp. CCFEE 6253]